jgi:hypothetical protein
MMIGDKIKFPSNFPRVAQSERIHDLGGISGTVANPPVEFELRTVFVSLDIRSPQLREVTMSSGFPEMDE